MNGFKRMVLWLGKKEQGINRKKKRRIAVGNSRLSGGVLPLGNSRSRMANFEEIAMR